MLLMRLPRERLIFTVDWIPVRGVLFQNMPGFYLQDLEEGLKKVLALEWDRNIRSAHRVTECRFHSTESRQGGP